MNLAEVLLKSKVKGYNGGLDELQASLVDMGLTMVPFDAEQAALVPFVHAQGELLGQKQPKLKGSMSLADCTCIATALQLELPIVGDDVLWTALEVRGPEMLPFR